VCLEQIFKAATICNTRKFKLDPQVGTIEPGKIANLAPVRLLDELPASRYFQRMGIAVRG
jgi:imidazolonepropionase-like amidohydrolase